MSANEPQAMNPALPESDEISLLDLLLVLTQNARLLIAGPLVAGLVAFGYTFTITPTFTATTRILPPQQQQSSAALLASQLGTLSSFAGAAGLSIKNSADVYVALIRSRVVADRIISRFDLMRLYETNSAQGARGKLARATDVIVGKDGLIVIQVDDMDSKRAADIANAYVEELSRRNDTFATTEAQQRRQFFEKQLQKAQEGLTNAQFALGESGVPESLIKSSPEVLVAGIANLRAQVTVQEVKLFTMRGYLTEQSPEFQMTQRELAALRARLALAEHSQPAKGAKPVEYINRYRDVKYHETLLDLMTKQYEAARLDESRQGFIQVVDTAVPPESISKPNKKLIVILATLVAGVLLPLYVLVRQSFRNAQNNPESAGKLTLIASELRRVFRRK